MASFPVKNRRCPGEPLSPTKSYAWGQGQPPQQAVHSVPVALQRFSLLSLKPCCVVTRKHQEHKHKLTLAQMGEISQPP